MRLTSFIFNPESQMRVMSYQLLIGEDYTFAHRGDCNEREKTKDKIQTGMAMLTAECSIVQSNTVIENGHKYLDECDV